MLNIVIFGAPGAGKGTQSLRIAERYNLIHLSTGDIFRNAIKQETELGKQVKQLIDLGQLVPDHLVVHIIVQALEKHANANGFIFDGFPRTQEQAKQFGQIMDSKQIPVNIAPCLNVSHDELVKRMLIRAKTENRTDDTEDIILSRLDIYKKQTEPLLEFYKNKGKLIDIDGMGSIDEVFKNLTQAIDHYLANKK